MKDGRGYHGDRKGHRENALKNTKKHEWIKHSDGWQVCKKCGKVRSLEGRFGGGITEDYGCTRSQNTRYAGLESGKKIREFSSKAEAEEWKNRHPRIISFGQLKGKRMYTIRRMR